MKTADHASGWQVPVLALTIVLLAPLTEELLFRGALLRSLLRKVTPASRGADQRGGVRARPRARRPVGGHVIAMPAIILLGIVSGYQAAKTGNLSRSILLHVGFNALSVVVPLHELTGSARLRRARRRADLLKESRVPADAPAG